MTCRQKQFRGTGFTLIEAVFSVFIVSVLVCASLATMGTASTTKLKQTTYSRSYALATMIMSEILQQPYSDGNAFGPQTGATRSTFADVDDYNGYSQTPPTYQNGAAIPGYSGYTVSVAIAYIDPATMATTASDKGLKRITVTVTSGTGGAKLVGLRSTYGRYDQIPGASGTYVDYVGLDLQVGSDSRATISGGVNPVNVVP